MNPFRLFFLFVIVSCITLSGCLQVDGPESPLERAGGAAFHHVFVFPSTNHPVLTVTNEYIDPVVSSSPDPAMVILEVPAGLDMEFCWSADASDYGGKVEAYRYGWDIADLNDPGQWAIDFTPLKRRGACAPPRAFSFGTHTFHVEVIDEFGSKSQVAIKANISPFPLFFDVMPESCPNSFNPKKKGALAAVVPGTTGFDVHSIDVSTLALWIEGNMVLPIRAFFADVTSPGISDGECDCTEGRGDGVDDLVLKFSAEEIAQVLGTVRAGDIIMFRLQAGVIGGPDLWMSDCVTIVGNPNAEWQGRRGALDMNQ